MNPYLPVYEFTENNISDISCNWLRERLRRLIKRPFSRFSRVSVSPARLDFACRGEIRHGAYQARTSRGRGSKHTRACAIIPAEIISPRLVFKQEMYYPDSRRRALSARKFSGNHSNTILFTLVSSICKSKGTYFIDFAAQIMNINEKCKIHLQIKHYTTQI